MGGNHWLSHQLIPIIGEAHEAHLSHETEWILMAVSVSIALVALLIAVNRYKKKADEEPISTLGKFLYNKWYIDEFYNNAIVATIEQDVRILKRNH